MSNDGVSHVQRFINMEDSVGAIKSQVAQLTESQNSIIAAFGQVDQFMGAINKDLAGLREESTLTVDTLYAFLELTVAKKEVTFEAITEGVSERRKQRLQHSLGQAVESGAVSVLNEEALSELRATEGFSEADLLSRGLLLSYAVEGKVSLGAASPSELLKNLKQMGYDTPEELSSISSLEELTGMLEKLEGFSLEERFYFSEFAKALQTSQPVAESE